jgi:putative phage-type endonuclease
MEQAMDASKLTQGSEAWHAARIGSVGGSRIAGIFTRPRAGSLVSKVRESLFADLLAERLTGRSSEREFGDNAAVEWGKRTEPFARAAYEEKTGSKVELAGLIPHPVVPYSHASPDGLVGLDGGVEIKCPNTKTHLETVRKGKVPTIHLAQIKWNMACTKRLWWDFVSFDPRAEDEPFFCQRVYWDHTETQAMEMGVFAFVMELEARLAAHQWNEEELCASQ